MTELLGGPRWRPSTRYAGPDDGPGRHAIDEDALLTPIFHALNRGGWRRRQHEPATVAPADPVEAFRRDPLTAPIPILPAVPAPADRRSTTSGSVAGAPAVDRGRHHRTRAAGSSRW